MHASQVTLDHAGWPYKPEGLTAAQLNLPFCVATLLIEGDVFVDEFTPDCVADPARIALARKVKVVHDPAITALGAALSAQGARRDPFPRRFDRERDPRGAARQRAFVRQRRRYRQKVSQAREPSMGKQQDAIVEAMLELDKLAGQPGFDRFTAAATLTSDALGSNPG